jgi:hypothetical protein
MRLASPLPILALCLLLAGCDDGVLTFPEPAPANVRVVNTTQDVADLTVVVDAAQTVHAVRGAASTFAQSPAGRPVGFLLKDGNTELRDTLYYTLGGNAKVILFTYGAKTGVVEFRDAIQDTTLSSDANPVIRFTHMATNVNQFSTLEVWLKGGSRLMQEDFDPGLTSSGYTSLAPGTYSFEVREYKTTNVAATLENVVLERGKSYMLYTWDAEPPTEDKVALSIF